MLAPHDVRRCSMSARIEIDQTEPDGIGIVLEGTPEWVTPAQARRLAADLIAAAEAVERAMP